MRISSYTDSRGSPADSIYADDRFPKRYASRNKVIVLYPRRNYVLASMITIIIIINKYCSTEYNIIIKT